MLALLLASSMVLAACGSGNSTGSNAPQNQGQSGTGAASGATSAEDVITVEYWDLMDTNGMITKIIEDFHAEHPNIRINFVPRGGDAHKEALKVAATSGTLPDVWFNWGGSLGSFYAENGFALDLTEYRNANNLDDKFVSAALNYSNFDGKQMFPKSVFGMAMIYRKDLFEQYGVSEPQTFEEFERALQVFKDNGIIPMSAGGKYGWHTMRYAQALLEKFAGPELHDQLLRMEVSWENPAVVQMFAKLKEWTDKGYFPEGFITLDPDEVKSFLYRGEAAMQLEGPHYDSIIPADGQDLSLYGVFAVPSDHEPQRISGFGDLFQINAQSDKAVQEAALQFVEFFTSKQMLDKYQSEMGTVLLATKEGTIPAETPNTQEIKEMLDTGNYDILDQAMPQQLVQSFFQAQDSVIIGSMTPEEAASFMQKEIENYRE